MNSINYFILLFIILFVIYYSSTYLNNYEGFTNDNANDNAKDNSKDIAKDIAKDKKKIYILYTGGTIGMVKTKDGYAPKKGFLEEKLKDITQNHKETIGNYTIKEYTPLLDSSNISPKDWNTIAQDVMDVYDNYDAFIIIHGTDTMAYTASALSFIFSNLNKPIIITGSMISLAEMRNDGNNNLINSLVVASNYNIPEVVIVFSDKIVRGNRSTKLDSNSIDAFVSPKFSPLGVLGVNINIDWNIVRKSSNEKTYITKFDTTKKMAIIKLFPGITGNFIRSITAGNINGIVLESFGIGDAPTADKDFLDAITEAHKNGIIMVNITQCVMGRVDEEDYETGTLFMKRGVISGKDMTPEAGLAKLYYLFSLGLESGEIKSRIGENMRGELVETKGQTLFRQTLASI